MAEVIVTKAVVRCHDTYVLLRRDADWQNNNNHSWNIQCEVGGDGFPRGEGFYSFSGRAASYGQATTIAEWLAEQACYLSSNVGDVRKMAQGISDDLKQRETAHA